MSLFWSNQISPEMDDAYYVKENCLYGSNPFECIDYIKYRIKLFRLTYFRNHKQ